MYDSHVHFLGTGQIQSILDLKNLKSPFDLTKIKIDKSFFQGEWLTGFGWDHHQWSEPPHKKILDQIFPDFPVVLTRIDGHASWVNSKALELAKITKNSAQPKGGSIEMDESGEPTGILIDAAKFYVDSFIPPLSDEEVELYLWKSHNFFISEGYTHLRDMTTSSQQWRVQQKISQSPDWKLFTEHYFVAEHPGDVERATREALNLKKENNSKMKFLGVKLFYDGSLGSETALLSEPYASSGKTGIVAWNLEELKSSIALVWKNNLEISLHGIGDQASENIVNIALELKKQNISGKLCLEHVEVLKKSTIQKMKELNVVCYMQPCHWLSDKAWLKEKLGPLFQGAFLWRELEEQGIALFFGSDSPIEHPNFERQKLALRDASAHGIPSVQKDILTYFTYPHSIS